MWRSGVTRRNRRSVLVEMIEGAVRSANYEQPWRSHPRVWDFFRDDGELLCELQREWRTALAGAVYIAIDAGDGDLRHDVLVALDKVQRRQPGLRRILDANADHPAIASAMRKERALLSWFLQRSAAAIVDAA